MTYQCSALVPASGCRCLSCWEVIANGMCTRDTEEEAESWFEAQAREAAQQLGYDFEEVLIEVYETVRKA